MNINPVAANMASAANLNAAGKPRDGDGDNGIEPPKSSSTGSAPRPGSAAPTAPNSTVSVYA